MRFLRHEAIHRLLREREQQVTIFINPDGSISDPYRNFISVSRYARWLPAENRRETWTETVDRYVNFFKKRLVEKYGYSADDKMFEEVRRAILNHEVMPSMRALMTAGPALERSNIAGYNCSFIAVDNIRAFDEALYILMCGTGVGFSVERRHVEKLPPVPAELKTTAELDIERGLDGPIIVDDSKEGWAEAFQTLLDHLWQGEIREWDTSRVRQAGERLETFGGRASGPAPLEALFRFTVDTFRKASGRRLTPLECHDLMCKIGDIVVVGGVRRSALISLSDLNDFEMAKAKSGNWWEDNGQRALANNSATYMEKPPVTQFLREWRNLIESQSGERGIYNLAGAREHAGRFAERDSSLIEGTNPCGEILLRSLEFCNLTEVIIGPGDDTWEVERKVRLATIIGTWQSTLTDFNLLRPEWKKNCEEERLLGVSLTGIYGNRLFNNYMDLGLPERLERLRKHARTVNHVEARKLGINPAAAITCVKPSGTVSQLTGVSSGIHPWHSEFYIRTVRASNNDPLTQMMKDAGIPNEPDVMKPNDTTVFSFPMRAPHNAITREKTSALDHLKLWAIYREFWTEHNPSVTINVREEEWIGVGAWVYENWDKVGGVSFLPHSEHVYQQAPYQEVTEEEYFHAVEVMPKSIRWADLALYELMDSTTSTGDLACSAGQCEIVDITSAV